MAALNKSSFSEVEALAGTFVSDARARAVQQDSTLLGVKGDLFPEGAAGGQFTGGAAVVPSIPSGR